MDYAFPYYGLIRILNFYLDLECWIISKDDPYPWNPIRYHNREAWPIEFDDLFGKREERETFNRLCIKKTISERKTYCGVRNGLSNLFVPITQAGKIIGMLQSGVFLTKGPDRAFLLESWKELTGKKPQEFEPEFSRYVATILQTPLVEGPVYAALKELLEIYAKVIADEIDREKACKRVETLKNEVFSKHLPHRFWAETAVKNNRVYPPTWW
ncbi:MAG TPA: PocR ligand-binding domain-containing protein, partial [bacterium]|nr:PocR ligand-binding domain-containing protein [bacterium]